MSDHFLQGKWILHRGAYLDGDDFVTGGDVCRLLVIVIRRYTEMTQQEMIDDEFATKTPIVEGGFAGTSKVRRNGVR